MVNPQLTPAHFIEMLDDEQVQNKLAEVIGGLLFEARLPANPKCRLPLLEHIVSHDPHLAEHLRREATKPLQQCSRSESLNHG